MTVIIIFGILSIIAMPRVKQVNTQAKLSRLQNDKASIQTSVDKYYLKNQEFPCAIQPTFGQPQKIVWNDIIPNDLKILPADADKYKYWVDFTGCIWITDIDIPRNVEVEGSVVRFDEVAGAEAYQIGYISETAGKLSFSKLNAANTYNWLSKNNYTEFTHKEEFGRKIIETTILNKEILNKKIVVSAISKSGLFTPPVAMVIGSNTKEETPVEETPVIDNITKTLKIPVVFDSGVKIGQEIGEKKDENDITLLSYVDPNNSTQALFKFNLVGLEKLSLKKATIHAYYYTENGNIEPKDGSPVKRVKKDWSVDDTLNTDTTSTTTEGEMTAADTSSVYGWRECDVTDLVTKWIGGTYPNYGVIIDNNSSDITGSYWNAKKFYSSEANNGLSPYLEIEYTGEANPVYTMETVPVSYDTTAIINHKIGENQSDAALHVLSSKDLTYNEKVLLTFDTSKFEGKNIIYAALFGYYYTSDDPTVQQTHPVKMLTKQWDNDTVMTNDLMSATYTNIMNSINSNNNGYGWRMADITDILQKWASKQAPNYGLAIDNNGGKSNGGGVWSDMQYYSKEANNGLAPYIEVIIKN